MTGAYQDIMGDLHNLFGRVNEAHVFLDPDEDSGFYIEETISGHTISQVLELTQYSQNDLLRSMKEQINRRHQRRSLEAERRNASACGIRKRPHGPHIPYVCPWLASRVIVIKRSGATSRFAQQMGLERKTPLLAEGNNILGSNVGLSRGAAAQF